MEIIQVNGPVRQTKTKKGLPSKKLKNKKTTPNDNNSDNQVTTNN